jgi:hypothetical protein
MITISTTISPALAKGEHSKQIPFALSKAINATLEAARTQFLSTLPSHMHLRGTTAGGTKPGTALGFNIKFSNKSNLVGTLGSRAPWWPLQEEGGTKTVSGHRLAIAPTRAPFGARPSIDEIIKHSMKPRVLLVRKGDVITRSGRQWNKGKSRSFVAKRDAVGFILKLRDGRGAGIFIRTKWKGDVQQQTGFRKKKGDDIKLLYWLTPDSKVKPALGFFSSADDVIKKNFGIIFNREFDKALATAR